MSLRDPNSDKYTGDPANWDAAEETLRRVARDMNIVHENVPGEAALWAEARLHGQRLPWPRMATGHRAMDYNLPERFNLQYIGPDNARISP